MVERAPLQTEAEIFGKYVAGREPSDELLARYVSGHEYIFTSPPARSDEKILNLIQRHPSLLPYLDAALGWLEPRSLLRQKLLVMSAILEATPENVDEFLPRRTSIAALIFSLAGIGLVSAFKIAIGVPILFLIRISSR